MFDLINERFCAPGLKTKYNKRVFSRSINYIYTGLKPKGLFEICLTTPIFSLTDRNRSNLCILIANIYF